jgi:nucleotidyltransferase/DNA polymerase involved in DNA repair
MSTDISKIEGLGEKSKEKLEAIGIHTVKDLREATETDDGIKRLHEQTGIYLKYIEDWAAQVKLHQIKGVNEEYADLLQEAGFNSKADLANQKPLELLERLHKVNQEKNLVRRMPSVNQILRWIEQGKKEKG